MPPPRTLPLLVSGLVFTLLAVVLPMLHLNLRPSGMTLLLLLIPPAMLVVMLLAPRLPGLSHFAFPLAHLPILLTHPDLAGPRIYAGASGLVAFLAVIASGVAYLVCTTPRLTTRRVRPEALASIGLAIALAPAVALAIPALASERVAWPAMTCLVLGPLVAWWLVARSFVQQVAVPALDPSARTRAFYALRSHARPRTTTLVVALVLAVLTLGLLAFWSFWSIR